MIKELHEKLKNGEVTSVELARKSLEAIEEKDGEIGAFLSVRKVEALKEATKVDEKIASGEEIGLLEGIPYAAKDVLQVRGEVTTAGSKILEGVKAPYDATAIARLKEAGAILVGKTNCDEFAMGASTETSGYKLTKNPHDLSRVPGGSSGGSAAAVAAEMVPYALGSDTGGSIRQPAGFCGVVGLKTTYGRVSRYGLIAMASSLDSIGPFARTTEDAAAVLSVISGEDKHDATSAQSPAKDYTQYLSGDIHGMKIGVPRAFVNMEGVDDRVKEKFEAAVRRFEKLGAVIEDIELPYAKYALPAYYIIVPSEVSSNMARFDGIKYGLSKALDGKGDLLSVYLGSRKAGLGAEVKRRVMLGTYALSAGYYDAYYKKAQKVRALIRKDFEEAYKKVDMIFTPTSPELPFKIGAKTEDPLTMYLSDIFTVTANMAGIPGISFPIGIASEESPLIPPLKKGEKQGNLPIGGQLLGKWFDEEGILNAVDVYEKSQISNLRSQNHK